MSISRSLLRELECARLEYKTEYSLKNASTLRIGGICSLAVLPRSESELCAALGILDEANARTLVLGRCSNTLFGDGEIDICAVFTSEVNGVRVSETQIDCGAGAGLMRLSAVATREGLSGLEFCCGIPGSFGGGAVMNAGAYGSSLESVIAHTRAYDRESREVKTVTEHSFSYRSSIYSQNRSLVCLGGRLMLTRANSAQIQKSIDGLMKTRREKQPLEYPSAGSYFKRPEGDYAGRLIELCGLKGARIGDAQVSEKHAGFIVNRGEASCEDVLRLEELVRQRVYEMTGVELEREVELVR